MSSGIRQTRQIQCPECGATGTVQLGMAMVYGVLDRKDLACGCGCTIPVEAAREVLGAVWQPQVAAESASSKPRPA